MTPNPVLYICYDDVGEPLVRTQVIAYLNELAQMGFEMHLLTFQKRRASRTEQAVIRDKLLHQGIRWYGVRYHRCPTLPATLYDMVVGSLKAMAICINRGIRIIHGRSDVGAAIGALVSVAWKAKVVFDVRGLLADEYVDAGRWTRSDIKYRLTKAVERYLLSRTDAVVVLTQALKTALLKEHPALPAREEAIEVIPCCVRLEQFSAEPERQLQERMKRQWTHRYVIVYLGKLGGPYPVDEIVRFFEAAVRYDSRCFLQILTQSDPAIAERALVRGEIPAQAYNITSAPPDDVPNWLIAADAGISFRNASRSSAGISPTKVAEYLAAGLPVVSMAGIGDCDELLRHENRGVIIMSRDTGEYRRAARALLALPNDSAARMSRRETAKAHFSIVSVGAPRYVRVYQRLVSEAACVRKDQPSAAERGRPSGPDREVGMS